MVSKNKESKKVRLKLKNLSIALINKLSHESDKERRDEIIRAFLETPIIKSNIKTSARRISIIELLFYEPTMELLKMEKEHKQFDTDKLEFKNPAYILDKYIRLRTICEIWEGIYPQEITDLTREKPDETEEIAKATIFERITYSIYDLAECLVRDKEAFEIDYIADDLAAMISNLNFDITESSLALRMIISCTMVANATLLFEQYSNCDLVYDKMSEIACKFKTDKLVQDTAREFYTMSVKHMVEKIFAEQTDFEDISFDNTKSYKVDFNTDIKKYSLEINSLYSNSIRYYTKLKSLCNTNLLEEGFHAQKLNLAYKSLIAYVSSAYHLAFACNEVNFKHYQQNNEMPENELDSIYEIIENTDFAYNLIMTSAMPNAEITDSILIKLYLTYYNFAIFKLAINQDNDISNIIEKLNTIKIDAKIKDSTVFEKYNIKDIKDKADFLRASKEKIDTETNRLIKLLEENPIEPKNDDEKRIQKLIRQTYYEEDANNPKSIAEYFSLIKYTSELVNDFSKKPNNSIYTYLLPLVQHIESHLKAECNKKLRQDHLATLAKQNAENKKEKVLTPCKVDLSAPYKTSIRSIIPMLIKPKVDLLVSNSSRKNKKLKTRVPKPRKPTPARKAILKKKADAIKYAIPEAPNPYIIPEPTDFTFNDYHDKPAAIPAAAAVPKDSIISQLQENVVYENGEFVKIPISPELKKLLAPFDFFNSFLVGGLIRDAILRRHVHDADLVVECSHDEIMQLKFVDGATLLKSEYRDNHYTLQWRDKGLKVDISIYPELNLEKITALADISINSLVATLDGNVFDPHKGYQDLENDKVVLLNEELIEKDPIRILRTVRIANKTGKNIDNTTIEKLQLYANKSLKHVNFVHYYLNISYIFLRPSEPISFDELVKSKQLNLIIPTLPDDYYKFIFDENGNYHKIGSFINLELRTAINKNLTKHNYRNRAAYVLAIILFPMFAEKPELQEQVFKDFADYFDSTPAMLGGVDIRANLSDNLRAKIEVIKTNFKEHKPKEPLAQKPKMKL